MNKFGNNADIDNVESSVWQGPDFAGPERCPADTTAFTLYISSDAAGDTEIISVSGLDGSWDAQTVEVTLAGLAFTKVGATSGWMRINRAYNMGTTALVGTVYLHIDSVDAAVADGIPDTPGTDIKTIVNVGEDQTLQACYTIPDGFDGYLTNFCASALAGGAGNPVTFRLRHYGNQGPVNRTQTKWTLANGSRQCQVFDPPVKHEARHMLEITGISTGAASNAATSGTFDLFLRPAE
jgi:hypothetical protein